MCNYIQGSPEWLEMRKNHIGGSDAPVIMGVSPWRTPYQLWQEKLGIKENEDNAAMKRGRNLEPVARSLYIERTGIEVEPQVLFHPTHSWMMASLDGVDESGKHVVELKCAGKSDHAQAQQGQIPEKYFPQLQHQLEVLGLDSLDYGSFHCEDFVIVKVFRDDKYIKNLVSKEKNFYDCLTGLIAPELTDRDYKQHDDPEWARIALELKNVVQDIKRLEEREESLKKLLIELSGHQPSKGQGVTLAKLLRKGNIDYKQVPQLHGIDLEPYRKESTSYWKVNINE